MSHRQRSDSELLRLRRLRQERDRLNTELRAVEDGTLPWIEMQGEVRADQLADEFGISLPAANNRLVRLVEAGLLDRDAVPSRGPGGRAYLYRRAA